AKQIGIVFLDDVDNETLLNKIHYSLIVKRLAIVMTVVACLSFACASVYRIYRLECLYQEALNSIDVYSEIIIEEYPEDEIPKDMYYLII
ncbi:MAG: hypothetical protein LUG46_03095, partial [Erysipelotrichaceae bacterium]|nr:hypothetical protein [Erysipelotrichaceae bacterium]